MTRARRWLREPLVHFVAIGSVLFLLWNLSSDRSSLGTTERIVISEEQVLRLVANWTQTWNRPPTDAEVQGIVDGLIKEEVYYREALAMGLDQDDPVIRRRLQQKIELLSEDISASVAPADEELLAFLTDNADDYRLDPRVSFIHVYLSTTRRGDAAEDHAVRLLAELEAAGDPRAQIERGDPLPLPQILRDVEAREVARSFGDRFAAAITELEPGSWQGPIVSGFGLHLVYVEDRVDGRAPELEEVRDEVTRDFLFARRNEMNEALFRQFRERYEITVQYPEGLSPRSTDESR